MLLHLDTDAYYSLNRLGTVIWHEIEAPIRLGELIDRVGDRLSEVPSTLEHDIIVFLDNLAERELIVLEERGANPTGDS